MEKSTSLQNIGKAITLFQTKMEKIKKDATNPFFKSKYATLSNILESIQIPLAESGLSFAQLPDGDCLTTILIHNESGEYLQSCYSMHPAKVDPQGIGSAISYARRYALSSILGLNVDDDDANAATHPQEKVYQAKALTPTPHEKGKIQPNVATVAGAELPWLSQKQFDELIYRINSGELDVLEKAKSAFRMKKEFRESLESAVEFSNNLTK